MKAGKCTVLHTFLAPRAGMVTPTQGQRGGKSFQGAKLAISHMVTQFHLEVLKQNSIASFQVLGFQPHVCAGRKMRINL